MPNPVVIATWPFGQTAVRAAMPLLRQNRPALDAAVAGAQAVEDDPRVQSVGYGGLPNAIGNVQLDACVMDGRSLSCGGVAAVENVRHVAALARRVMERTNHVLLAGAGAQQFAMQQGFALENLHTPESQTEWERRRPRERPDPRAPQPRPGGAEDHDTVTVLALDQHGTLGGVCSTSGLAHKLPGRVGDSPLIGAGLYVDNNAGAAGATGVGEEVVRICGSFFVVEQMRAGRTPQEACEAAVRRVNELAVRRNTHPAHVAFLALDTRGRVGAAATAQTGFQYAVASGNNVELLRAREIEVESR
jgi:isoaspartyl peptidase/L-asparaginase-like protein (Ntn-hydrolase superfamily)